MTPLGGVRAKSGRGDRGTAAGHDAEVTVDAGEESEG